MDASEDGPLSHHASFARSTFDEADPAMADEGSRLGGPGVTNNADSSDITIREYVTMYIHAVDKRLSDDIAAEQARLDSIIAMLHVEYDRRFKELQEKIYESIAAEQARMDSIVVLLRTERDYRFAAMNEKFGDRFTALIAALDDRKMSVNELVDVRFAASDRAVQKVEATNEKRFESVNEFRNQSKDRESLFATRLEMDARVSGNAERMDRLEQTLSDRLKALESSRDVGAGRSAMLGAAVVFALTLIGLLLRFVGPSK